MASARRASARMPVCVGAIDLRRLRTKGIGER